MCYVVGLLVVLRFCGCFLWILFVVCCLCCSLFTLFVVYLFACYSKFGLFAVIFADAGRYVGMFVAHLVFLFGRLG